MRRFVQISAARHGLRSPPGNCDPSTTNISTPRALGRGTAGRGGDVGIRTVCAKSVSLSHRSDGASGGSVLPSDRLPFFGSTILMRDATKLAGMSEGSKLPSGYRALSEVRRAIDAVGKPFVYGRSVRGEELFGTAIGSGEDHVLVVAGIHAQEWIGVETA